MPRPARQVVLLPSPCATTTPQARPSSMTMSCSDESQRMVTPSCSATAFEIVDQRGGARHGIVHARPGVRRLGIGTDERDAEIEQPLERLGCLVGEDAPQHEVVGALAGGIDQVHVGEVPVGIIVDAGALLMRRRARGIRAHRPARGAADLRRLLHHQHLGAACGGFGRAAQAGAAAADHDHIEPLTALAHRMHHPLGRRSATAGRRRGITGGASDR